MKKTGTLPSGTKFEAVIENGRIKGFKVIEVKTKFQL